MVRALFQVQNGCAHEASVSLEPVVASIAGHGPALPPVQATITTAIA